MPPSGASKGEFERLREDHVVARHQHPKHLEGSFLRLAQLISGFGSLCRSGGILYDKIITAVYRQQLFNTNPKGEVSSQRSGVLRGLAESAISNVMIIQHQACQGAVAKYLNLLNLFSVELEQSWISQVTKEIEQEQNKVLNHAGVGCEESCSVCSLLVTLSNAIAAMEYDVMRKRRFLIEFKSGEAGHVFTHDELTNLMALRDPPSATTLPIFGCFVTRWFGTGVMNTDSTSIIKVTSEEIVAAF
eukprot:GHVN01020353.1.p1 GENE.GHVN01020353.1~~GHVN01020353.1.p1  ORF type:complete len:246 (+),score=29.53 GHVN01020353.1:2108-2845(+)